MDKKYFPLFAPGDILEIPGIEFVDVVLYAVVYGLCKSTGCCFASNEYLADRLKVSKRSIQRSLKRLHGFDLLFAEHDENNRRIFLKRHVMSVMGDDTPVTGGMTQVSHQNAPSLLLINKDNKQNGALFLKAIEEAYKNYPLKKGKTVGVKRLLRQINSEEKLNQLRQAIKNYASECKGKEPQYIKHFSTFANCWQDYLEAPSPAKSDWVPMKLVDGKLVPVT